jgi:predicted peptidase
MQWMRNFAVAAIVLLAVGGPQTGFAQMRVREPGMYNQTLTLQDGIIVGYAISIPKNYSPGNPVPLVLALHFSGRPSGAGQQLLRILVGPAFEGLGAIIVAPDSIGGGWETSANDRAVVALLDGVQAAYRIDPKKIVVTGFSMGGAGTWHFAGKYPERFSAAIPVSGRPPASIGTWHTPVLAIHSRQDEVVSIGPASARIKELQKAGVRAELIELTGISHYETNRFVDGLRRAVPWLKETWR